MLKTFLKTFLHNLTDNSHIKIPEASDMIHNYYKSFLIAILFNFLVVFSGYARQSALSTNKLTDTYSTNILTESAANSHMKREMISINSQYVLIEILRDDNVHFEMSFIDSGVTAAKPIITTPMINKTDYSGPTICTRNGNTFDTKDLQIIVDPAACYHHL